MRSLKAVTSRFTRRLAGFAATVLALLPLPATAQDVPSCRGRDMLAELKRTDPKAYERVAAAAERETNAKAIFWRIEGKGVEPSYLLGTVHVTDDRVHAMTPKIRAAFAGAKRLALEIGDFSAGAVVGGLLKVGNIFIYTDGRSLKGELTAAEYEIVRLSLKRLGLPVELANMVRPWLVTMVLALPECEIRRTGTGRVALDLQLQKDAKARGIEVIGLETIEDQLRAMAAIPDADQLGMLRTTLKSIHLAEDMFETLILRYLERNLGAIWAMQEVMAEQAGVGKSGLEAFENELVTKRNRKMRDAAIPLIDRGGSFVAVGALHLPGRNGLVHLLREAGYSVTPGE